MENWGLVTYQEGGLLYEENVSSWLHKEVIATLIAHELAHQVRERKTILCINPHKNYMDQFYFWIKVPDSNSLTNFSSFE